MLEFDRAVAPDRGGDMHDAVGALDEPVQRVGRIKTAVDDGAAEPPIRQAASVRISDQQTERRVGESSPERNDCGLADEASGAGHGNDRHAIRSHFGMPRAGGGRWLPDRTKRSAYSST